MIGIIILNYNNWNDTVNTIESFTKHYNNEYYKIYLIDNNSSIMPTEENLSIIKKFSNIEIIFNKENKGYSAGNNVGIKKALEDNVDKIVIANNDVIVNGTTIDILSDYLDLNEKVGMVGPKVYLDNGEIQEINLMSELKLSTRYKLIINKASLGLFFRNTYKKFYCVETPKNNLKVFAVSGCFFMISREFAKEIYPLDEDYFLYMEEATLGMKLKEMDLEAHYIIDSTIIHLQGQSTKSETWKSFVFFIRSEITYFKKYHNKKFISLFVLFIIRKLQFYNRIIFTKGFFSKRKFMIDKTRIIYTKINRR